MPRSTRRSRVSELPEPLKKLASSYWRGLRVFAAEVVAAARCISRESVATVTTAVVQTVLGLNIFARVLCTAAIEQPKKP